MTEPIRDAERNKLAVIRRGHYTRQGVFISILECDFEWLITAAERALTDAPLGVPPNETAWLLERKGASGPEWIGSIDGFLRWTPDINKVLRLCRREDADALAEIVEDAERITEHMWPSVEPPTPEGGTAPLQFPKCDGGIPGILDCDLPKGHTGAHGGSGSHPPKQQPNAIASDSPGECMHGQIKYACMICRGEEQPATAPSAPVMKPFDEWVAELKLVMKVAGYTAEALSTVDAAAWRDYYDEGASPVVAFMEDCSYD